MTNSARPSTKLKPSDAAHTSVKQPARARGAAVKLESILTPIPVTDQVSMDFATLAAGHAPVLVQGATSAASAQAAQAARAQPSGSSTVPTKAARPFGFSVIRTAYILRGFLIKAEGPNDITQMSEHLGFAASTVHRVLTLMQERGLARHEPKRVVAVALAGDAGDTGGKGGVLGVRATSRAFAWSLTGTKEDMEAVFGPCPESLDVTVDAEAETMAYASIWAVAQGIYVSTTKTRGVRTRLVASGIAMRPPQRAGADVATMAR